MASNTPVASYRSRAMVGQLPPDFLRIQQSQNVSQAVLDAQHAQYLQMRESNIRVPHLPPVGRLTVSLAQATLAKNYGFTKMDPYCRIRVGHTILETQTCSNGAKNPRWNKSLNFQLPTGVDSFYVEIFDERALMEDTKIAWVHVPIPERVLSGEMLDEWYTLSGKEGDGKEGMINIILSYAKVAQQQPHYSPYMNMMLPGAQAAYYHPTGMPLMVGPQGVMQPQQQPIMMPQQAMSATQLNGNTGTLGNQQQPMRAPQISEEDVKQIKDMFPDMDNEVIVSVLQSSANKDTAINSLLQMSSA